MPSTFCRLPPTWPSTLPLATLDWLDYCRPTGTWWRRLATWARSRRFVPCSTRSSASATARRSTTLTSRLPVRPCSGCIVTRTRLTAASHGDRVGGQTSTPCSSPSWATAGRRSLLTSTTSDCPRTRHCAAPCARTRPGSTNWISWPSTRLNDWSTTSGVGWTRLSWRHVCGTWSAVLSPCPLSSTPY